MENNCFIGIDVSKNKLDICVLQGKEVLQEDVIDNNPSAIQRFLVDMAESGAWIFAVALFVPSTREITLTP